MSFSVQAVKVENRIHTCWDDAKMIPDIINSTPAKVYDSYGVQLIFPKKTIIVENSLYVCNSAAK